MPVNTMTRTSMNTLKQIKARFSESESVPIRIHFGVQTGTRVLTKAASPVEAGNCRQTATCNRAASRVSSRSGSFGLRRSVSRIIEMCRKQISRFATHNVQRVSALGFGALLFLGGFRAIAVAGETKKTFVPDFALPRFGSGEMIARSNYAGGIVVLDFFAHWCPPCRVSVPQVEQGIRQYYSARGGNGKQVPVHVIFVNTDQDSAPKTAAFIKSTGASLVGEDVDGALLKQFGGDGLPFLVVLDGTEAKQDSTAWKLVHHEAGFGGLPKLREIIDGVSAATVRPGIEVSAVPLTPPSATLSNNQEEAQASRLPKQELTGETPVPVLTAPVCKPGDPHCAVPEVSLDAVTLRDPGTDLAEVPFDALWSDDVALTDSTLSYQRKKGRGDLKLGVSFSTFDVDYRNDPITDPLGVARKLSEQRIGFQARYQHRLADRVSVTGGGSYYEGFTDYRNLWLSEYYRQQFDFFPSYEKPDPRGWGGFGGARFEYLPATGFVEFEGSYRHDEVAPGNELVFSPGPPPRTLLETGRTTLETRSARVRFENVLSRRLRSLLEFQLADTTGRETRYSLQGALNIALAENWVARLNGGYTRETPQLEASWLGASVEHDWDNRWFLGATARYYTDTGYLENSGLISDATPELQTYHAAMTLRWQGERAGFRLSAGPFLTRYGASSQGTIPFQFLYQDRDWFQVQASLTFKF